MKRDLYYLLSFFPSQEEFGDLLRNGRDECKSNDDDPFSGGQEVGIEDWLQEWNVDNQKNEDQREGNCILHILVREDADLEERGFL